MKNYTTLFNDAHLELVIRTKRKNKIAFIIAVFIIPALIQALIALKAFNGFDSLSSEIIRHRWIIWIILLVYFMICAIVDTFLHATNALNHVFTKELSNAADRFASITYYNDLIKALESKFKLTIDFKLEFISLIKKYSWLDSKKLCFDPDGITFEAKQHHLRIEKDGSSYYLRGWKYTLDAPFIFIFDKMENKGKNESSIEISLPINK